MYSRLNGYIDCAPRSVPSSTCPVGRAASVWADARDGANPYAGMLGWADRIVCSSDSVNMLSEACATRAPQASLPSQ